MQTAPNYYKSDYINAQGWTITSTYTMSKSKPKLIKTHKVYFIPLIKWMPNICKWLGLGKMVRRNKRRV